MELGKNIEFSYSGMSMKTCAPTGNRFQRHGPAISTLKKQACNMLFLLIDPSLRRGAWPGGAELTDFSNWKNNLDITLLDLDQNDS